ncbi:hypothetical protein MtrunA17_Chr8g0384441 [Medicago truncatula]|uniref:Transmembrane protein n=1 Tax=Medicago truncatula TaxID=3880 RepID=A0A396GPR3_MEDTR|nr:uncharacterized protein LOC112417551 [Medicago truncatula]RHN43129.1 hypothetical protein MtrunA17_Chr8g0384441 [Medicago truncatula]
MEAINITDGGFSTSSPFSPFSLFKSALINRALMVIFLNMNSTKAIAISVVLSMLVGKGLLDIDYEVMMIRIVSVLLYKEFKEVHVRCFKKLLNHLFSFYFRL